MASALPTPPHERQLTGRWHRSTCIFTAGILLFLLFCNLPGQLTKRIWIDGEDESFPLVVYFGSQSRLEHGWPFTYLVREPEIANASWGPYIAENVAHCWTLWRGVERFSLTTLLLNLVLGVIAAAGSGILFEIWRRRRKHPWQFHLSDMFIVTAVVCVFGACYAQNQRRPAANWEVTHAVRTMGPSWTFHEAGPTWLRWWVGDTPFRSFDEGFEVTVWDGKDLPNIAQVASLESVKIECDVNTERLKCLEDLPRLTMLDLGDSLLAFGEHAGEHRDDPVLTLPNLPNLRALSLSHSKYRTKGIRRLSSLEVLDLGHTSLDEQTLEEVSFCRRLKALSLAGRPSSPRALASLQALPELERLGLWSATLDDAAMQAVGGMVHLKYLSLEDAEFSPGSLRHLSNLRSLRVLELNGTLTDDAALEELILLPNLRYLYLGVTRVTEKSLVALLQKKQLRELLLPSEGFSARNQHQLRKELSECDVNFALPPGK